MYTVVLERYDVYGDGTPNTATIRIDKFHFKEYIDADFFRQIAGKQIGNISAEMLKGNNRFYSVATAVGGIMEQPEITYENKRMIVASSDREAVEIYDSKYSNYYYYGEVLYVGGETQEEKTDPTPIDYKKEAEKRAWLKK